MIRVAVGVALELIRDGGSVAESVIDVGAGASVLVDDLLAAVYNDVTVLDVSAAGLDVAKRRLGVESRRSVGWLRISAGGSRCGYLMCGMTERHCIS